MEFKTGDRVEAIDENGNVRHSGFYLGKGYPKEEVGVKDKTKLHYAVQVDDSGGVAYLQVGYWTLRPAR